MRARLELPGRLLSADESEQVRPAKCGAFCAGVPQVLAPGRGESVREEPPALRAQPRAPAGARMDRERQTPAQVAESCGEPVPPQQEEAMLQSASASWAPSPPLARASHPPRRAAAPPWGFFLENNQRRTPRERKRASRHRSR